MNIKTLWILFFGLVAVAGADGLGVRELSPDLKVGYDFTPSVKLSNPAPGFEQNVRYQASILSAGLNVPLYRSATWILSNGVSYRYSDFNFDHWDPSVMAAPPDQFHSLFYRLALVRVLENNQSIRLFLSPGLSSDFENIAWNQVLVNGGASFNFGFTRSHLGVGLAATTVFGKQRVLPFLQWDWSDVSRRWWVVVTVPAAAEAWYFWNEKVQGGLSLGFTGGHYRIGEAGAYQGQRVEYSSARFGPVIRLALGDDLALKVQSGVAFRQRYGIFDGDHNELLTLDPAVSGFVRVALSYRMGKGSNKEPWSGVGLGD